MRIREFTTIAILAVAMGSCATLNPIADPKPAPAPMHVHTMEIETCGARAVGTAACAFTTGQEISGAIQIRIPYTNTAGTPAKVEFVSEECNVDDVESAAPGQTVSVPVSRFMGTQASKSCSVQVQMTVTWDGQSSFTFPISPIIGQILLLTMPHPLTNVSNSGIFPVPGYAYVEEVQGASALMDAGVVAIDTQGSTLGQIIYQGCGLQNVTEPYEVPNPPFAVPRVDSSCTMFATVQRVDKGDRLSFALHLEVVPVAYTKLAPPVLIPPSQGESDPAASAVDLGNSVVAGGQFKIPSKIGAEYDIRQVTTGGRYSLSHVSNGVVEWTLQ